MTSHFSAISILRQISNGLVLISLSERYQWDMIDNLTAALPCFIKNLSTSRKKCTSFLILPCYAPLTCSHVTPADGGSTHRKQAIIWEKTQSWGVRKNTKWKHYYNTFIHSFIQCKSIYIGININNTDTVIAYYLTDTAKGWMLLLFRQS